VFIGHYAVAFAAKRAGPAISLGTLFVAAQLADLIWPVLVLAGVERFEIRPGITAFTPLDFIHYPWSHSLVALALWGTAFGVAYMLVRKARLRAAVLIAALVVSHWVLDAASHRPDMPLAVWDSPKVGLGLWNSIPATVAVEGAMFVAGVWMYARATRAIDRIGTWALAGLVAFLAIVYVANFMGPPPPSVTVVAWSANLLWLVVAWGYWIDRHRTAAR
jgi:hypothetical protein